MSTESLSPAQPIATQQPPKNTDSDDLLPFVNRIWPFREIRRWQEARFFQLTTRILSRTRKKTSAFRQLNSLSQEDKDRLSRSIIVYAATTAKFEEHKSIIGEVVGTIIVSLILFALVFMPAAVLAWFRIDYADSSILVSAIYLAVIALTMAISMILLNFADVYFFETILALLCIIFLFNIILAISVIVVYGASPLSPLIHGLLAGLLANILMFIGIPYALWADSLIDKVLWRWFRRQFPDAAVVNNLFDLLKSIEESQDGLQFFGFKNNMVGKLETVAHVLQHNLPRTLHTGDTATDLWLKKTVQRMAAAQRQYKKWIIMPKPDTKEILLKVLAHHLKAALSGSWDAFEQAEPESVTTQQVFFRIRTFAQSLLAAVAPLLILGVLQQTPLALEGTVADIAIIAAVGYLLISLMSSLDPSYQEKITSIKTVRDLLPF